MEGTWAEVSKEAASLSASSRVRLEVVQRSVPDDSMDQEAIRLRMEKFEHLLSFLRENRPKDIPELPDEAFDRDSIYGDRGL